MKLPLLLRGLPLFPFPLLLKMLFQRTTTLLRSSTHTSFPRSALRYYSAAPISSSQQASITRSTQLQGLTYLELNRPKAKNALSVQMVQELRELIEEIRFDGFAHSLFSFPLRSDLIG